MAETERLDRLCRIGSLPDFSATIFPDTEYRGITDLQHQLVHESARELSGLTPHLTGPRARLVDWILIRFRIRNIKILIRAHIAKMPAHEVRKHLVLLPEGAALGTSIPATTDSLPAFIGLLPKEKLRKDFEKALVAYSDNLQPFFLEAVLDCGYFSELLARVDRLPEEDRDIVRPAVR